MVHCRGPPRLRNEKYRDNDKILCNTLALTLYDSLHNFVLIFFYCLTMISALISNLSLYLQHWLFIMFIQNDRGFTAVSHPYSFLFFQVLKETQVQLGGMYELISLDLPGFTTHNSLWLLQVLSMLLQDGLATKAVKGNLVGQLSTIISALVIRF